MSGITLRQLLTDAVNLLQNAGLASPEVDARELVMHALGLSRTELLTRGQNDLSAADVQSIWTLIEARASRVPLQHLLGEVEWGGVRLKVDGRALVPRPETEMLLELAVAAAQTARTILDIGTGTGALALGLKNALPHAEIWATDLSSEALALARENALLNGLEVHFVQGNLFAGLTGPFDLIVSNPPYLPETDRLKAEPEVQHDPELALYSGNDGLRLARELVAKAAARLAPGGTLLLELDPRNVERLAGELSDWHTEILSDLAERPRFLRAVRTL